MAFLEQLWKPDNQNTIIKAFKAHYRYVVKVANSGNVAKVVKCWESCKMIQNVTKGCQSCKKPEMSRNCDKNSISRMKMGKKYDKIQQFLKLGNFPPII